MVLFIAMFNRNYTWGLFLVYFLLAFYVSSLLYMIVAYINIILTQNVAKYIK